MGNQLISITHGNNHQLINKDRLHWENIKDQCIPIGNEGYYANAFFYKSLNLVIKKMRTPKPRLTLHQIVILDKLAPIFPNLCEYQLMENNILSGLSMKYFKGQKWDDLLSHKNNIFRASPVARIKLITKLAQIIKQIQKINICHGDIHVANMIIQIDEKSSLIDPQFQIFLIDYGNGFEFRRGQLVNEGLNGWSCLIPPEAAKNGKKNYEPSGVNAYQLGRVALHILLLQTYQDYHDISSQTDKELTKLKAKEEYPRQLITHIQSLIDINIQARNNALMNLNLTKVEDQTRQLLLENIKKQEISK